MVFPLGFKMDGDCFLGSCCCWLVGLFVTCRDVPNANYIPVSFLLREMLRPAFKKYFQEDNFGDSPDFNEEEDAEPFVDASPAWESRDLKDGNSAGKSSRPSRPSTQPTPGQNDEEVSGEKEKDPNWDSERSVYELQLNQLQEQLVETMVENQQLGNKMLALILITRKTAPSTLN